MSGVSFPAYDRYLQALAKLHACPDAYDHENESIATTYHQSVGFATMSVEDAARRIDVGNQAIERHLRNAAGHLAKAGQTTRIPPRIKPSSIPQSAPFTEVDATLKELGEATIALGRTVDEALRRQQTTTVAPPSLAIAPPQREPPRARTPSTILVAASGVIIAAAIILAIIIVIS